MYLGAQASLSALRQTGRQDACASRHIHVTERGADESLCSVCFFGHDIATTREHYYFPFTLLDIR